MIRRFVAMHYQEGFPIMNSAARISDPGTQNVPSRRVFVVDDDDVIRDTLRELIQAAGLECVAYPSAEAFIDSSAMHERGCLLLDVSLPRISGPELQKLMRQKGCPMPIIFLTGHGDVRTSVRTLHAGAFDFLEKPIDADMLIERLRAALELEQQRWSKTQEDRALRDAIARLTTRERRVMELTVRGGTSKEIGRELNLSHRTVEVYRARLMRKLQLRTSQQLVAVAYMAGIAAPSLPVSSVGSTDVE